MASSSAAEPLILPEDRTMRSTLALKLMVLLMHLGFVGAVFVLDPTPDRRIHEEPWCMGVYGVLVLLTLVQYFYTAGSSPGYVVDVVRAGSTMHATFVNTATLSIKGSPVQEMGAQIPRLLHLHGRRWLSIYILEGHAAGIGLALTAGLFSHLVLDTVMTVISVSFSLIITVYGLVHALEKRTIADFAWCAIFMLTFCGIATYMLAGLMGGLGHWWYIFEETILCIWTVALYIESLSLDIDKAWWKDFVGVIIVAVLIFILIFLLLLWLFHSYIALTNQTTYEVARRRRISYFRSVPERVHPFSKGICRNIYDFCAPSQKGFVLEVVPPLEELEARAARNTCLDVICCSCC